MWTWFHKLGSPPYFYRLAGTLSPWFAVAALILIGVGVYGGLVVAPEDYQQKDAFRIIYVHVPSAYLSLMIYVVMATAAAIGLIWRMKLAQAVAAACAPVGASFTLLALVTGSLWGKPMWGSWWEWDPRLTSELVLLFLYLGYIALRQAFSDTARADRASALLAVVGLVNVPIIHYSVKWWNSLHQGPIFPKMQESTVDPDMVVWLLLMIAGFTCYFAWLLLVRVRAEVLERGRDTRWVREAVEL